MESGMYLYPWEINNLEYFAREYEQTGCNGIAPALSYHHGNTLNARTGHFYRIGEAALSFSFNKNLYGDLKPKKHSQVTKSGMIKYLRQWCIDSGRQFSGWAVLLHNSTLGSRYPSMVVENMMGDKYEHALCPANKEVIEYSQALLKDICEQLSPDSLILESITLSPVWHGGHHEIANIKLTPALQWLYSLCFCKRCMDKAVDFGIDSEKVRSQTKELVLKLANRETFFNNNGDAQILMILLEVPELYAYQMARQRLVSGFMSEVSLLLRKYKVEYRHIPSAVPFEVNKVFMEGMSFASTKGFADMLMPLVYGVNENYPVVRNNIRLFDDTTPIGMTTSLIPERHPLKSSLFGAVVEAKEVGCNCFYFYNFSIASKERLFWMQEVNKIINS